MSFEQVRVAGARRCQIERRGADRPVGPGSGGIRALRRDQFDREHGGCILRAWDPRDGDPEREHSVRRTRRAPGGRKEERERDVRAGAAPIGEQRDRGIVSSDRATAEAGPGDPRRDRESWVELVEMQALERAVGRGRSRLRRSPRGGRGIGKADGRLPCRSEGPCGARRARLGHRHPRGDEEHKDQGDGRREKQVPHARWSLSHRKTPWCPDIARASSARALLGPRMGWLGETVPPVTGSPGVAPCYRRTAASAVPTLRSPRRPAGPEGSGCSPTRARSRRGAASSSPRPARRRPR